LLQGSFQAVGKPAELPLQWSEMIPEIMADMEHLSAGFVAPKVHGCGYDLLRFGLRAGDVAAMGPWMHGTMGGQTATSRLPVSGQKAPRGDRTARPANGFKQLLSKNRNRDSFET